MTAEDVFAITWLISIPMVMLILWFTGISFTTLVSPPTRPLRLLLGLAMLAWFVNAVAIVVIRQPYIFGSPIFWRLPFLASVWANLLYRVAHRPVPNST